MILFFYILLLSYLVTSKLHQRFNKFSTHAHPTIKYPTSTEKLVNDHLFQIKLNDEYTLQAHTNYNPFHKDYKEITIDSNLNEISSIKQPKKDSCYFKGHIIDINNNIHHESFATISLCNNKIRAVFSGNSTDNQILSFEPIDTHLLAEEIDLLKRTNELHSSHTHVLFDNLKSVSHKHNRCGFKDHHHTHNNDEINNERSDPFVNENDFIQQSRRLMGSNECTGGDYSSTKYLEVVIVNDVYASELRPNGGAEEFASEVFAHAANFYADMTSQCQIELRLVGQISFRNINNNMKYRTCGEVDEFLYNATFTDSDCCDDIDNCERGVESICIHSTGVGVNVSEPGCYDFYYESSLFDSFDDTTLSKLIVTALESNKTHEVDVLGLLREFGTWAFDPSRINTIESLFNNTVDNLALFTGRDFVGEVRGLGNVQTQCTDKAVTVEQVTEGILYTGSLLAHEIGHNFDLSHVSPGSIMEAASSISDPAITFSTVSINELNLYFENTYGVDTERCLENDTLTTWEVDICGDGRVTGNEECDPGLQLAYDDSCCIAENCTLAPGCECSNSDACCIDGKIANSSVVCRPIKDAECDIEDYCDGISSSCPSFDFRKFAGTECGVEGVCFEGECYEYADVCDGRQSGSTFVEYYCPKNPNDDGGIYACVEACATENEPCPTGVYIYNSSALPDGTMCWDGCQCVSGKCYESDSLGVYTKINNDTDCIDEQGNSAPFSKCSVEDRADKEKCKAYDTSSDTKICIGYELLYSTGHGVGCEHGARAGDECWVICDHNDNDFMLTCTDGRYIAEADANIYCPGLKEFYFYFDGYKGYMNFEALTNDFARLLGVLSGGDEYQFHVIESYNYLGDYNITVSFQDPNFENITSINTLATIEDEILEWQNQDSAQIHDYLENVRITTEKDMKETPFWKKELYKGILVWHVAAGALLIIFLLLCCKCGNEDKAASNFKPQPIQMVNRRTQAY